MTSGSPIQKVTDSAAGPAAPYRPLSTTLSAVAVEIDDLAKLSDRLQSLISAALTADGAANSDHMKEFQAIDLLVQRLHGVAIFMSALAESTSVHWHVDAAAAAAGVPLGDLARRLGGLASPTAASDQTRPLPSGDLDLFG